jgi:Ca2+-binding RTX toxin-like protein
MGKNTHRGGWRTLLILSGVSVSAVAIFVVAQVFIYSTNVEGTCKNDIFRPAVPEPSGVVIRGDGDTDFTNGPTLCPAGQYGNDNILGTSGRDTLSGDSGDEDPQAQIRTGRDTIYGQAGDDLLDGETGNDALFGGPGGDVLKGGPGKDLLDGGEGNDILEGGPGSDRLLGQEGNDLLLGDEDNDILIGGPGDDELDGGPGSDILVGGPGSDPKLIGGLGNDVFQFQAGDVPDKSEEMVLCTEHHAESGIIYLQQGAFTWDRSIPVTPMDRNTELIINASSGGTIRVLAGPGTCYVRFRKG